MANLEGTGHRTDLTDVARVQERPGGRCTAGEAKTRQDHTMTEEGRGGAGTSRFGAIRQTVKLQDGATPENRSVAPEDSRRRDETHPFQ